MYRSRLSRVDLFSFGLRPFSYLRFVHCAKLDSSNYCTYVIPYFRYSSANSRNKISEFDELCTLVNNLQVILANYVHALLNMKFCMQSMLSFFHPLISCLCATTSFCCTGSFFYPSCQGMGKWCFLGSKYDGN